MSDKGYFLSERTNADLQRVLEQYRAGGEFGGGLFDLQSAARHVSFVTVTGGHLNPYDGQVAFWDGENNALSYAACRLYEVNGVRLQIGWTYFAIKSGEDVRGRSVYLTALDHCRPVLTDVVCNGDGTLTKTFCGEDDPLPGFYCVSDAGSGDAPTCLEFADWPDPELYDVYAGPFTDPDTGADDCAAACTESETHPGWYCVSGATDTSANPVVWCIYSDDTPSAGTWTVRGGPYARAGECAEGCPPSWYCVRPVGSSSAHTCMLFWDAPDPTVWHIQSGPHPTSACGSGCS